MAGGGVYPSTPLSLPGGGRAPHHLLRAERLFQHARGSRATPGVPLTRTLALPHLCAGAADSGSIRALPQPIGNPGGAAAVEELPRLGPGEGKPGGGRGVKPEPQRHGCRGRRRGKRSSSSLLSRIPLASPGSGDASASGPHRGCQPWRQLLLRGQRRGRPLHGERSPGAQGGDRDPDAGSNTPRPGPTSTREAARCWWAPAAPPGQPKFQGGGGRRVGLRALWLVWEISRQGRDCPPSANGPRG